MGRYALRVACVLGLFFAAPLLFAGEWANFFVDISVPAMCQVSFSGDVSDLRLIIPPIPGNLPDDAVDNSTTYAITTNNTVPYKITGQISTMPADRPLELKCTMAAPTGATSGGQKTWDVNNDNGDPAGIFDMVTDIDAVAQSGLGITWTLHCTGLCQVLWGTPVNFTITCIPQ